MPRFRILPYRPGSRSASALAAALGGMCLRTQGSRFRPRPDDLIINWGSATLPTIGGRKSNWIDLRVASNKLSFFRRMRDAGLANDIPLFWTNQRDIPDDAFPIVCRTVLAGHSGEGIVIAATRNDLVPAPLYVKYIKKQEEYRIHVGRTRENQELTIISVQRKARRLTVRDEDVNWQVRNLAGGFVFQREGVVAPDPCLQAARNCLRALDLDFGAVDIGYHNRTGATVYEVNTAPGLEGQTVTDYANFFRGV